MLQYSLNIYKILIKFLPSLNLYLADLIPIVLNVIGKIVPKSNFIRKTNGKKAKMDINPIKVCHLKDV